MSVDGDDTVVSFPRVLPYSVEKVWEAITDPEMLAQWTPYTADRNLSRTGDAVITMLTKNAFLEEIRKQYVLTARAKGLSERTVLWKHVLRNAMIPLVTGFPAAFIGAFFTGSLLIETLFSLDGLGLLSYESVMKRDYPVVLGSLYLFTLIGLVTKLISDLCYVWVDPRVKFD